MSDVTSIAQTFDRLLRGDLPAELGPEVARMFDDDLFRPHHGLTESEQSRLNLRRVSHLCAQLPGTNLARDPERMFTLVAKAAAVDPSLSVALVIHHGLCLSFLADFTTSMNWLRPLEEELVAGRAIGSFLITELGHGNSQLAVRTQATYDPETDGFVLHTPDPSAQKFMGNTGLPGIPRVAVVSARLVVAGQDRGAFPFVVRLADADGPSPGVHSTTMRSGVVPMDYSLTRFDRVRLPRASWLCDGATIDPDGTFTDPLGSQDERLLRSVSTAQNVWAGMAGALALVSRLSAASALNFSAQRRTTARIGTALPVLSYTTQQRPLLGALADSMAVTCLANASRSRRIRLIEEWRRGERPSLDDVETITWAPWAPINRALSMTKVMAAWTTEAITAECRLRCGVLGALAASRFLDYQGLGHMLNAGGGDNLLIALDTARSLIAHPAALPATDPAVATDQLPLLDPLLWRELLVRKANRIAGRVREAISLLPEAERESFEAWNPHLMAVRELGETYGQFLVVDATVDAVRDLPAGEGAEAARALCAIHALRGVERSAAWYLCEELLTPKQVQDLDPTLSDLTASLAPHVGPLVEAFAADRDLAGSPLLTDDYIGAVCASGS